MRFLSWSIGLVVAAIVVVFALSNRAPVLIGFWPFMDGISMPVYLTVLLSLLVGGVLGWLLASWRGWRRRRAEKKAAL